MTRTCLLATFAFALATPVLAEPFTLFIYESPEDIALRSADSADGAAYWTLWTEYAAVLDTAGVVRGGAPLMIEEADGLTLSGYFILDAASRAEAEALADRAPSAARGGDAIIMPHLAMPGMSD